MLLLDTCAIIWLANGEPMSRESLNAIEQATLTSGVLISSVSAWEIGLLAISKKSPVRFNPSAQQWLATLLGSPGVALAPFTPEAALEASFLPGTLHGDPGDRLLIATARQLDIPLVTRDSRIINYAKEGHVKVLVC